MVVLTKMKTFYIMIPSGIEKLGSLSLYFYCLFLAIFHVICKVSIKALLFLKINPRAQYIFQKIQSNAHNICFCVRMELQALRLMVRKRTFQLSHTLLFYLSPLVLSSVSKNFLAKRQISKLFGTLVRSDFRIVQNILLHPFSLP